MITRILTAFCIALCTPLLAPVLPAGNAWANGQEDPRASPHYGVRERYNYEDPQAAYWEGFELKNEGNCEAAIERLRPLARNGRGYESAQHAYGLCLMSLGGLPAEGGSSFDVGQVEGNEQFQQGRIWVVRAANSGHFQAQRTLLALYAANIGPDKNPVEIGKWLRLYDVNPLRLTLGAVDQNDGLRKHLRNSINRTDYLDGKELARNWTPTYWAPPGVRN